LGDTVNIGEAALGICFPLKAFSSHPMHPVPHLSTFYETRTRDVDNNESLEDTLYKNRLEKNKKKRVV
jgi:hypothetical protein